MSTAIRSKLAVAALLLQQLTVLALALVAGEPACERSCCLIRRAQAGDSCAHQPGAKALPEPTMVCHGEEEPAPKPTVSCAISARCNHSSPGWTSMGERYGVLASPVRLVLALSREHLAELSSPRPLSLRSGSEPPPPRLVHG